VRVRLANRTTEPVSFHPDMLAADPNDSGIVVGADKGSAVAAGAAHAYTFYADPALGETTALVRDTADIVRNPRRGLYGAIVVGPRGARYTDPVTGSDASASSSWAVDVKPAAGKAWRDFSLFLQDEDAGIGTHRMPYTAHVDGTVGINYRKAPLGDRLDQDTLGRLYDPQTYGDPDTPLMRAYVGDAVRIHVLSPSSEQAHVFTLEGHEWPMTPGLPGTDMLSSVQVGGLEAVTIDPQDGAGGRDGLPGDYLYGDHREPYREAGMWGIFRVRCPGAGARLEPLSTDETAPGACGSGSSGPGLLWPGVAAVLVVAALLAALRLRRRL
jgi:hypothetical protein